MTKLTAPRNRLAAEPRPVRSPSGELAVYDHGGTGRAVVALHGYPDDSRIWDRVVEALDPATRFVTADFAGYGRASRPAAGRPLDRVGEIAAILDELDLDQAVLVGHDASTPTVIDYALRNPDRVSHLVLMNGYYGPSPTLRFPEMIQFLADPLLRPMADAMMADPGQRLWLLRHTATRFGQDPMDPHGVGVRSVVPQFFGDERQPDAVAAIRRWTAAIPDDLARHQQVIASGALADLPVPVTVLWGADDEYLDRDVAHGIAGHFTDSRVEFVSGAVHWAQWDRADLVADRLTRTARS